MKNLDIVRDLINLEKTDINMKDDSGNAPLHFAVRMNSVEIVKLLCSNWRCDKNLCNSVLFTIISNFNKKNMELLFIFTKHLFDMQSKLMHYLKLLIS